MVVAGNQQYQMVPTYKKLYFAYVTFVDRPDAFDNADQLNEADRLHTKLFDQNPDLKDCRKMGNQVIAR